jgi:capsular exopolysaccharide synthesis family protein
MDNQHSRHIGAWRAPQGVDLRDYLSVILKRRYLVAAATLAVLSVSVVQTLLETPQYRASALIQIDWGKINLVQDVIVEDVGASIGILYMTEEKIMQSRPLAERIVRDLKLWEHPVFGGATSAEAAADQEKLVKRTAGAMLSMMRISHVTDTQLIEVTFQTPDPELSAQLANALVHNYILFTAENDSGVARDTLSFIREKIEDLQKSILEKERLLRDYNRGKHMLAVDKGDPGAVSERVEEHRRQLAQAEAERAAAEAHYRSLTRARPEDLPEVQTSARVQGLREKESALREQYAELGAKYKPEWPEMQRLAAKLAEVRESLDHALREEAGKAVAGARVNFETARERERLLEDALREQSEEARDLLVVSADYEQVRSELENEREILQGLLRRASETGLSADLREQQPAKVRIVQGAEVPGGPFSPNVPMSAMMGALLGCCLGIGLAFVLDYADSTLRGAEDVKRCVSLPCLGMIPRYGTDPFPVAQRVLPPFRSKALPARTADPSGDHGTSYLPTLYDERQHLQDNREILNERLKFLRGSLLLSTPGSMPKTILITSPEKGAGKSFVSCNLGLALVQLNKRVLLVDSDLRNPRLHKVFNYHNRAGLTNVLTGQRKLNDGCVVRTETPNLFLLMAGPKSPTPGELLASQAMDQVLESSARYFDFVVLDSAPLLPVFDTHALCTRADAVLLVARCGQTSRHEVKSSVELIEKINGKVTGVVLNDVDLKSHPGQYYGSYTY